MAEKQIFIKATEEYNTFDAPVPAYYFRRVLSSDKTASAKLTIAVCGVYELWFNGKHITRGLLSPYFSNPNHFVYADEYDVTLDEGENVVGIILGNGFQNNPGGYIWNFDEADFRSAPSFSLAVTTEGKTISTTNEDVKICPSPIRSDDYRFGENYDANYEVEGWCEKGFDDSAWQTALVATEPKGEIRVADVAPIVNAEVLYPVSIIPAADGYIYDFGVSHAGVCRLRIKGRKGQYITFQHTDGMLNGDIDVATVWFPTQGDWERDKVIVHRDSYICKGEGIEEYTPSFTYHGFRFVKVCGIDAEQATEDLLTYLVYHTELNSRGDFESSDMISTKLQEITRRSILSNFHHFPTDCPQREKNGWTADAALTTEAALINFDPERNYREWLRNICRAQTEAGSLPGIIPTAGWGFHWGNGPAWDCVLAYLPYFTYIYRGETEMITDSAEHFVRYLKYLRSRVDENGLLAIGLWDWLHVGNVKPPKSPLIVTDSIMALDISTKMALMFSAVGMTEYEEFARAEAEKYRASIREHLVDENLCVAGACQTSQAMALFYGVFNEDEKQKAFEHFLSFVHGADDHIDVGVVGGRVIFHVLSEFGYADLAYKMICRDDFPSYGNWIKRGATTLWERFTNTEVYTASMNHHFWGDISAWFIKAVAGIRLNPGRHNVNEVEIAPNFIEALNHASAYHVAPAGKISVKWERSNGAILMELVIPEGMDATVTLRDGYHLEGGETSISHAVSGAYKIVK